MNSKRAEPLNEESQKHENDKVALSSAVKEEFLR
jgi:hypothetical protein